MKIDAEIHPASPTDVAELARKAEEFGFDCLWMNETKHDPFVQLTVAAINTRSIELGTSIALAFTRSPVTLAYSAWDIQSLSGGRLLLGLGPQVKGHIERRFGMRWESPAPKMKEVVEVLRAVWSTWQTGRPLSYNGRFFAVNLMTPFFTPGPIRNPEIPVLLAGVNPGMCRLAGRLADGLHVHPFHTRKYLREVILPSLEAGISDSKRRRDEIQIAASVFAAAGDTREEIESAKEMYRDQIAFYASTRTYRRVLATHGWEDVCERLHEHSVKGRWDKMGQEITDEMLGEFVVEGDWSGIGDELAQRYGKSVDRVRLYLPFDGRKHWKKVVLGFGD